MTEPVFSHAPDRHRYEAHIEGRLAGYVDYAGAGARVVLRHAEVDPAHGGRGLGGALVRHALDDLRARGDVEVVPTCSFIAAWIRRHPEYQPLLAPELRPRAGAAT